MSVVASGTNLNRLGSWYKRKVLHLRKWEEVTVHSLSYSDVQISLYLQPNFHWSLWTAWWMRFSPYTSPQSGSHYMSKYWVNTQVGMHFSFACSFASINGYLLFIGSLNITLFFEVFRFLIPAGAKPDLNCRCMGI